MNELWIQIKFWTKTTLISVIVVYAGLVIYNNTGGDRNVRFWWWFSREPEVSVFSLSALSFIAGSLMTLLVKTTFTTMKQFKKAKAARLLKEREDELLKASKLKTTATTVSHSEPTF
jgi:uncharacterized membrane protein YciS (DUF1049 family)